MVAALIRRHAMQLAALHYNREREDLGRCSVGGGVIGLSLAWQLRHASASVLVVEKGEPAREATAAAGGMIAHCDPAIPPALAAMALASARMYPEFVAELRAEAFNHPTCASREPSSSPELRALQHARASVRCPRQNSRSWSRSSKCAAVPTCCQSAASIPASWVALLKKRHGP